LPSKSLIVVLGPTASGKTGLAIQLAEQLHTEVVSADSRQIYKELRIGSAMPEHSEMRGIPHHLIGHISVTDAYNVSKYEMEALQCLDTIFKGHSRAILCGGSGLYIDAVCKGIDELPDPDPQLRENLKDRLAHEGIAALQFELKRLDPEYYRTADIQNPVRLIRALEVCLTTGKTFSSLRKNAKRERPFSILKLGLAIPQQELAERIRSRTLAMISAGLVEEARSLLPHRNLNSLNTVGYKEIFSYLDGSVSIDEAIEKICVNTRRYAKRQMTWFRKDKDIHWTHPNDMDHIRKYIDSQS
jgi:tRNA dimethylallyltransferase